MKKRKREKINARKEEKRGEEEKLKWLIIEKLSKKMTEEYQKEIRKSVIWDDMVKNYGKEEAKQMLKGCTVRYEEYSLKDLCEE